MHIVAILFYFIFFFCLIETNFHLFFHLFFSFYFLFFSVYINKIFCICNILYQSVFIIVFSKLIWRTFPKNFIASYCLGIHNCGMLMGDQFVGRELTDRLTNKIKHLVTIEFVRYNINSVKTTLTQLVSQRGPDERHCARTNWY
uniref:Uncharacterized protein n=1 Tax=Glossina palpalis gambiensis TaxID=67801 RepID=A0A1B0BN81_9MUSC